jgi:flagellar basal-body rod protein FlgB
MIDDLFSSANYVAAKHLLDGTMARHEAIAANLANVQTPGYKRMDLAPSFKTELQNAVASGNASALAGLKPSLTVDATAVSLRPDGNTVQVEKEMLNLSENSAEHAVELHMITGNLLRLRLALTGKG